MKNLLFLGVISFLFFSCGNKKEEEIVNSKEVITKAPYDTTAIDSFSNGASSAAVALQIKMSSQVYQDSLKAVIIAQEEAKKLKKEEEKAKQKQQDEEKKKKEESKPETSTQQ